MKKEIFTRAEVKAILAETVRIARKRNQTAKQPEHGNGAMETESVVSQGDTGGNTATPSA